ncbi:hypothetical protein FHX34_103545 [Actinoplanes teichomyceticus]|uniref:Transcriptional regulator n=2 Tax=Actinoplanes teichomyceticus TaxID=1867 RepID=A0A561WAX4_ACTTI|nr:hypothetical protein FHX34_103545 [Actinoplanes teichomyceticus]
MHVAPPPPVEVRAGVFLKTDHFALVAKLLDLTTDAALSRAIKMDRITISRARDGIIGERFIAAVLSVFGEHAEKLAKYGVGVKFEDLFEIRDKAAAA